MVLLAPRSARRRKRIGASFSLAPIARLLSYGRGGAPTGRRVGSVRGAPNPTRAPSIAHIARHTHTHVIVGGEASETHTGSFSLSLSLSRSPSVAGFIQKIIYFPLHRATRRRKRCVMRVCFTLLGGGGLYGLRDAEGGPMVGRGDDKQQTYDRGRRLPPIHTHTHTSQRRLISDILFIHSHTRTYRCSVVSRRGGNTRSCLDVTSS